MFLETRITANYRIIHYQYLINMAICGYWVLKLSTACGGALTTQCSQIKYIEDNDENEIDHQI